jgi:hypothetical protein
MMQWRMAALDMRRPRPCLMASHFTSMLWSLRGRRAAGELPGRRNSSRCSFGACSGLSKGRPRRASHKLQAAKLVVVGGARGAAEERAGGEGAKKPASPPAEMTATWC